MAAATEQRPVATGEERFLLDGISWEFYLKFCEELGERPIRLTFDGERLEIMITKSPHEYYKKMLAKLVEATVLELDIPVRSGGNMTFQREDLKRGFEHDECWWIAHEADVRSQREFDFRHDPPPDLAIEVEISSPLLDRISIFAAMGVPEIWRFNGKKLRFLVLREDGGYEESAASLAFPFLQPQHLLPYLAWDEQTDETTLVRRFLNWLREQNIAK
jgi:Uma2 family endonuclease